MRKHGYHAALFTGSLAAGGTLGILIPPSINLIVYGVLTDTSVPQLYLAGFIPGFILSALFMLTILVVCLVRPRWGGRRYSASWRERWHILGDCGVDYMCVLRFDERLRNLSGKDFATLLAQQLHAHQIVVGQPLHMNGKPSPQSEKVARFAESLHKVLDLPIVFWDERLTSFEAEQHLEQLGLNWRQRREQVDKIAAMIILQNYLDRPGQTA